MSSKPNGKPRPIAVGDILDVIAGQCVLAAKRIELNTFLTSDDDIRACLASGDWKQAFTTTPGDPLPPPPMPTSPPPLPPNTPLQLAFAQAGTELAHFIIDHLYNIYQTIFGHDGVNTFNTIDRGAGAEALRLCPVTADLLPAYRLKYGNNRTLVFDRNTSSFDVDGTPVRSCVGPQQGDTWGTLICSVAHHRSFSLTQIRSPSSTLIGYADDGHFADPSDTTAYSSLLFFRSNLTARTGVTPNDKGGCISLTSDLSFAPASFPGSPHHPTLNPSNFAYPVLGGLIGNPLTVSQALRDRTIDLLVPLSNLRYLHDTGKLKNSLQIEERLISSCACASTTHLQAMHPPAVFLAAATAHDILILHAAALCYRPPPQSSTDDLTRARAILALPPQLAGRGILLATATSQATFLCARIRALAYARTLHPLFAHIDILTCDCPSVAPLRNLHAHFSAMHAASKAAHSHIDDADLTFCTFGTASARFRPQGLPSTAASDIPLEACDPHPDIPSALRFPTLRQLPSLDVLQGLEPSRFKGWRKTLTSIHAHCQWIALYLNAPNRSKSILISQSQPYALACVTADLADPLQKINTDILRPALLYHLHLPQLTTDPDGPDRYGDVSLNASDHNVPHNLVRDSHFTTAVSAYGSNCVELEPTEHSIYSPGKRPDIYLPELATILDAKVGRLVKASAPDLIQLRATHTAFALNEDDFFAVSLGRSQRGTKGDGPFNPADASGYVPAVRGEYAQPSAKPRPSASSSPRSPAPPTPTSASSNAAAPPPTQPDRAPPPPRRLKAKSLCAKSIDRL